MLIHLIYNIDLTSAYLKFGFLYKALFIYRYTVEVKFTFRYHDRKWDKENPNGKKKPLEVREKNCNWPGFIL